MKPKTAALLGLPMVSVLRFLLNEMVTVVAGGAKRQDSVANGLAAVADDVEIVLIHDGVRPFIKRDVIQRSIDTARETGACVVAMPLKETIKRVDDGKRVVETVDRSELWGAQTPQVSAGILVTGQAGNLRKMVGHCCSHLDIMP